MPKSKRGKKNDSIGGGMTPAGYMARIATGDGRRTNKTKNFREGRLF